MAPPSPGSHYAVLELEFGASADDIRKAHRKLALKWHPDKVTDPTDEVEIRVATQQFQLVQAAYEVLSDEFKKAMYDDSYRVDLDASRDGWKRRRRTFHVEEPEVQRGWAHSDKAVLNVPQDVSSIAAAVDQLPVSGGTIYVASGVYDGIVVVSKPFVNIVCIAELSERAIIRGQVVFRKCAAGAALKGFVISAACSGGAVDLKGVFGDVTIEDCDVQNFDSAGIVFEGCSGNTAIARCSVHDCKFDGLGLHLLEGTCTHKGSITVVDSVFERNGYDGLYLGDPRFTVSVNQSSITKNHRHGVMVRGTEFSVVASRVEGNGAEQVQKEFFKIKPTPKGSLKTGTAREVQVQLPAHWRAFRNAEGLLYYYHEKLGSMRWSHPDEEESDSQASKLEAIGSPSADSQSAASGGQQSVADDLAPATTPKSAPAVKPMPPETTSGSAAGQPFELADPHLPPGWKKFSTADGYVYYYHAAGGTTQWSYPKY